MCLDILLDNYFCVLWRTNIQVFNQCKSGVMQIRPYHALLDLLHTERWKRGWGVQADAGDAVLVQRKV